MLFGVTTDSLQDGSLDHHRPGGSLQVAVGLPPAPPHQQRDQAHRQLGARPATRLRCFLKEVHEGLWDVLWTQLHQRDVGDGWGCNGDALPAKQALEDLLVFLLRLDQHAEAILLLQLHVHQRLVLCLVKTSE